MYTKNEVVKHYSDMEEVIVRTSKKRYNGYNNLQKWLIYKYYGPKEIAHDESLMQMLMERFPRNGVGNAYNIELMLNKEDVSIIDILDGRAVYKAIKESTNNVKARAWTWRFEKAMEKYIGLTHPIASFLPQLDELGSDIKEVDICKLIEWLEEVNEQMEENQKRCLLNFRRKMYQDLKDYYKRSLDLFPKESIYLYHSWDDKGYIWVRQDQVELFEDRIKPFGNHYRAYDNEKPIDKMIGEKSCPSGYREYAYIPYYDCRYTMIDGEFSLIVDRILFETMRDKELMINYE